MRKFIAGLLVGVMLTIAIPAFASSAIRLFVNGQEVFPEVPPMVVKGTTMVPLRFVAEQSGAEVEWNNSSQAINIKNTLLEDLLYSTHNAAQNWISLCLVSPSWYSNTGYEVYNYILLRELKRVNSSNLPEQKKVEWIKKITAMLAKLDEVKP